MVHIPLIYPVKNQSKTWMQTSTNMSQAGRTPAESWFETSYEPVSYLR